jgi:serine-type D-Ala-D-Ala carboxypeptidase/endopeptidase (penicillin-binding protein 4)
VAVVVLAAGAGAGGYLVTHHVRAQNAEPPARTLPPTPSALASAVNPPVAAKTPTKPAQPDESGVTAALEGAADDSALGGRLLGEVLDASTGRVLYDRQSKILAAPASTAKLLTATALLAVRAPADRITTKVVAGAAGTVILVGGGDPTLTGAPAGQPGGYPHAARISDLAAKARRAIARTGGTTRRIVVDNSLFAGPRISPDWATGDVPSDYASAITAAMTDGGRAAPGDAIRSSTPDLAAGKELAAAMHVPDVPVTLGTAPSGAAVLATVKSPPLSELVSQMLLESDNVIAECLARQVAITTAKPATFTGAAIAIRTTLTQLGVDPGPGMLDGSGLAANDRISAETLADVLRMIVSDPHPVLHNIITSLPVAAWSGTLADRYLPGSAGAAGAGVVRAKTGTLTGVSTLAGIVHDADGRLLVFAFLADQVPPSATGTKAAEGALDRLAADLAGCGCH